MELAKRDKITYPTGETPGRGDLNLRLVFISQRSGYNTPSYVTLPRSNLLANRCS
jgi:hypothetical protein